MTRVNRPALYWLQAQDPEDWFPDPEQALIRPNGLLAVGGALSRIRLLAAYRQGLFPWYNDGELPQWWCPDPRCVLPTAAMHSSRSLQRKLRRRDYGISIDHCFDAVVQACAAPRKGASGTWINADMYHAYADLHRAGYAHSLEVWSQGRLMGGVYGVAIGRMFFGESMFSRSTDASKLALYWLTRQLAAWNMPLLDAQVTSAHLLSLGALELPRREFLPRLRELVDLPPPDWQLTLALETERRVHLPGNG